MYCAWLGMYCAWLGFAGTFCAACGTETSASTRRVQETLTSSAARCSTGGELLWIPSTPCLQPLAPLLMQPLTTSRTDLGDRRPPEHPSRSLSASSRVC